MNTTISRRPHPHEDERGWLQHWRWGITLFLLVVPSIRPVLATGVGFVGVVVLAIVLAAGAVAHDNGGRVYRAVARLNRAPVIVLLFAAFALACHWLFDWSNSSPPGFGNPTGDEALIWPFRALLRGDGLYDVRLPEGAPVSPGPLWILANGWLHLVGAHFLLTPIHLAIAVVTIPRNLQLPLLLFLLATPIVLTTAGTGHDHVAIGLAFLYTLSFARRAPNTGRHFALLLALSVVLGTARIVYAGYPLLVAATATGLSAARRKTLALSGVLLCILVHAAGAALSDWYQPTHLLSRGWRTVGPALILTGVALTLLALWWLWTRFGARRSDVFYAVGLAIPHFAVSMGELWSVHGQIALWEGANYLLPVAPVFLFLALECRKIDQLR